MTDDSESTTPNGDGPPTVRDEDSPVPSLPPPAFPPGSRRRQMRRRHLQEPSEDLEDGFISPDEPIPPRNDMSDAFISPDEPMPERTTATAVAGEGTEAAPEEDGTVTGIGHDPHLDPDEMAAAGDPHVLELVEKVGKLAQALKQKGEAGLHSHPEMDRFEATLRGYCVGYLAGRRADDAGS